MSVDSACYSHSLARSSTGDAIDSIRLLSRFRATSDQRRQQHNLGLRFHFCTMPISSTTSTKMKTRSQLSQTSSDDETSRLVRDDESILDRYTRWLDQKPLLARCWTCALVAALGAVLAARKTLNSERGQRQQRPSQSRRTGRGLT